MASLSSTHLLHDADGLSTVLRRRVQQDPVVQRLQHWLHRLHTTHQTHELRCNVAHGPHHPRNPGRGNGRTAGPATLIGHPTTGGVHLLANAWQTEREKYERRVRRFC